MTPAKGAEISQSAIGELRRCFLEQEAALELILSGRNVFLTGEAGTWKSTLVREFIRRCDHDCIVLAPMFHPTLASLRRLYETGGINTYDAPILNPLARSILDGSGVKEEDLVTIERLTAKY